MKDTKNADSAVFLTFDEVRILLYSQGFQSCQGIYMPEKDFRQQDILRALFNLTRRGLLFLPEKKADPAKPLLNKPHPAESPDKEKDRPFFQIRPDLRLILQAMGNPAGTAVYRPGEDRPGFSPELYEGPEYFCYFQPGFVAVARRDYRREKTIRLEKMDMDAFSRWRQEQEEEAADLFSLQHKRLGEDLL